MGLCGHHDTAPPAPSTNARLRGTVTALARAPTLIPRKATDVPSHHLGIDIDGVLAQFDAGTRAFFRDCTPPDPITGDNRRALDTDTCYWNHIADIVGEANWKWFWAEAVEQCQVFANLHPHHDNVAYLRTLIEGYPVSLITSRPQVAAQQTYAWLGAHGLSPQNVLHVVGTKVAVAQALGVTVVVDDSPKQLAAYLEAYTPAHVLGQRRPWNATLTDQHAHLPGTIPWIDHLGTLVEKLRTGEL